MSRFGFKGFSHCEYEIFVEINSTEKSQNKEDKDGVSLHTEVICTHSRI